MLVLQHACKVAYASCCKLPGEPSASRQPASSSFPTSRPASARLTFWRLVTLTTRSWDASWRADRLSSRLVWLLASLDFWLSSLALPSSSWLPVRQISWQAFWLLWSMVWQSTPPARPPQALPLTKVCRRTCLTLLEMLQPSARPPPPHP